jgi:hypothetical protein
MQTQTFTPCTYIPVDVSDDDNGSADVMDEPQSPEVRKRLAKLKELNDAYNMSDEDFEMTTSPAKTKRVRKKKGAKATLKMVSQLSYTVNTSLDTWNDGTEYGQSFRRLNSEEQQAKIIHRYNKFCVLLKQSTFWDDQNGSGGGRNLAPRTVH